MKKKRSGECVCLACYRKSLPMVHLFKGVFLFCFGKVCGVVGSIIGCSLASAISSSFPKLFVPLLPVPLAPLQSWRSPLDYCFAYYIFAVENWESYQAYDILFDWKRIEWTLLHLKHIWGSALALFPLWESLLGLLAHHLFGGVLIGEGVIWCDWMTSWTCGLPNNFQMSFETMYLCLEWFC